MAAPLRVVFLGTPEFAVPALRALRAAPGVEVVLVVTQPDRPAGRGRRPSPQAVAVAAREHGLPLFQPERLRGAAAVERLAAAGADLFVIAAYGQLLRPRVLTLPRHGCLNVHPSLLPRHRGPAPIAAAILAGDEETGVTIMLTDEGMDTGPILAQRRLPLPRTATTATLTNRLAEAGAALLVETIPRWVGGAIAPQPQDPAGATVSRLFTKEDAALDWARPALELERRVRAFNPWPRAYTFARGTRLLLLAARETVAAEAGDGELTALGAPPPGTVSADREGWMVVATGRGALRVEELQAAGRRPLPSDIYLRNNPGLLGARLASAPDGA